MIRSDRAALFTAIIADVAQLCLFPVTIEGAVSPVDIAIDVLACALITRWTGWHYALIPAFLVESIPIVTVFPTWTAAVLFVIRSKRKA